MKGVRHASRAPHMRPIDNVRCREDREKTPEEDTTTTIGKSQIYVYRWCGWKCSDHTLCMKAIIYVCTLPIITYYEDLMDLCGHVDKCPNSVG